ncbi:hypothetical protein ABEB36_013953 [Hypothenemus hampei]|uniref:SecA family profile domain-containing protein n=1 Tax=Hypothenemus hampei TaxID=57062 RepID=A0ABD1E5T1_HYPHA
MQTNTKGHISQINTGEGKTTIISVVAALKVMQGYKTHIITSNNVLAADGVKDKKLFYDLLNITTTDNNPDDRYTDGPKACYNKDIVYGSITSFQFDWLRDSFEQLQTLGDEIKKQIKNQKDHLINKTILAQHLHQYAEDSIERWIEHAFTAKYKYKENVEYKISKDKDGENIITPVDNQNTDYIKKYGSKLSGVTGTLGSRSERNLLGSVFNLEFSVIPPFKPKKFKKFPGKISADDKFVNDVAIAALGELARTQIKHEYVDEKQQSAINKPRAVLIVCASILDVEIIAQEVDKEAKAAGLTQNSILDVCDIVIATNLAGRGTDFKTSARLEGNCGLHVILAFLPCNKRVEDQGLGRTGRQGNNGTGQIITKISELEALGIAVSDNENIEFKEVITRRDKLETMRVNDIADNKITELEFKGQLFNKFSSLYGSLKKKE